MRFQMCVRKIDMDFFIQPSQSNVGSNKSSNLTLNSDVLSISVFPMNTKEFKNPIVFVQELKKVCYFFLFFVSCLVLFQFVIFHSWKVPRNWNLVSKFFCYITWLLYQPSRRDTGRLANEAFTSNRIVSSKQ